MSKFFTTGAAFVNEMKEPIPLLFITFFGMISILVSTLFPNKETLDQMTKDLEKQIQIHNDNRLDAKNKDADSEVDPKKSGITETESTRHKSEAISMKE